jgi:tol-pal system protein YbgF
MRRCLVILGGLALWVSPLFAQEYIDVEAERLQQSSQPDAAIDPQPDLQPASASSSGELYYQLQLLQQEVMELRGKVEEQEYELRQLKEQSLERYLDLDRRLSEGGAGGEGGSTPETPGGAGGTPVQPLAGEADAYRSAYSLVRSQQFREAIIAFNSFLQDFPEGRFAANAHYWLGELYLVIVPQDTESARREFNLLLEQHPDNAKVPDALYKLGKIYAERGNCERGREYLERVINEFGNSNSSAVKLARDFLSENC